MRSSLARRGSTSSSRSRRRRALGQHYLADEGVADLMVDAAEISRDHVVLEIGTGKGVLTKRIAPLCARLEGYEIDPDNFEETLLAVGRRSLSMHLEDAFSQRPTFDVLVSSLPYSRSEEFVEWLSQASYSRAVVLLQEDFVRKITSPPGSRSYRGVSALAQVSCKIDLRERVGREAFTPRPRVDSRIVVFRPRARLTKDEVASLKRLFALRRRTVSAVLKGRTPEGLRGRRVYQLSPDEVLGLVRSGAAREN